MQFIVLSKIPPSPCPFSHFPASFLISSRPLVSLSIYPICQETHGVSFTMKLSRGDNNLFPKALVVLFLRCHWLLLHQRALFLIFLVCMTVTLYLAVFLVPCPKMCFQPKYNFSWFDHEISFLNIPCGHYTSLSIDYIFSPLRWRSHPLSVFPNFRDTS